MKLFKKLLAVAMVALMTFSIAGCHKKNETAVTVGDVKFTSAYYMCALIMADTEARGKVDESLTEEEKKTEVNYLKKKVDKTDFSKWVKKTALENLKMIAAYKTKSNEAKLKLDSETENSAKQYAGYYWSSYGYSSLFEPNGVSQDTYVKYMVDSYYSNLYFEHVYGKDGKKEIAADEVKAKLLGNFLLADKIEVSFSEKQETEITSLKEKFNNYLSALQNGTMTFEQVYKDYNGSTEENTAEETDTEEVKPIDKYASILGAKDTTYASDYYDTAKAMANGEIKLIEQENNAGLVLLIKKDITADQYYMDNLDLVTRHLIADEEYEKDMKAYADKLEFDENKYATNQFKVKNIVYPQTNQQSGQTAQ